MLRSFQNKVVGGALAVTTMMGCGAAEVMEPARGVPAASSEVAVPRGDLRQQIIRALRTLHTNYRVLGEKKLKATGEDFRLGAGAREEKVARCMGEMRGRILTVYDEYETALHGMREALARCSSIELDQDVSFGCSADIAMAAGKGAAYVKYNEGVAAALASGIRCLDEISAKSPESHD